MFAEFLTLETARTMTSIDAFAAVIGKAVVTNPGDI